MLQLPRTSHLFVAVLFSLSISFGQGAASAPQDSAGDGRSSPAVAVMTAGDQVRFSAVALVRRIRLEVMAARGAVVFDSGFHPGNLLEWPVQDAAGSDLPDGAYGCLVTVEGLNGELSYRHGVVGVKGGRARLGEDAEQAAPGFVADREQLTFLSAGDAAPYTLVSHNGEEGWLESGKGGLSLFAGRLSRDRSTGAQMRLTPDGYLGVGVTEPQARLDVRGLIRTSEGILFPDGTIQRTAAGGVLGFLGTGREAGSPIDTAQSVGAQVRGQAATGGGAKAASTTPVVFASTGGQPRINAEEGVSNTFYGTNAGLNNNGILNENSFFGAGAGISNTTGSSNSFLGNNAGFANTTGSSNSFFGKAAGFTNSTGVSNAFFGRDSGYSNTVGSSNAFYGASAGHSNTTASSNSFFGAGAGYYNTAGYSNSFFGRQTGYNNTTGYLNVFVGEAAGYSNLGGYANSFVGNTSGSNNTTGANNAFVGESSGLANTVGQSNVFFGQRAGVSNTTGSNNSFVGYHAGSSNTGEANNTFLGSESDGMAGVTNGTAIGYRARVTQSNSLVLGSINGINGASASTKVGIGITNPERTLSVSETNGASAIRGVAFDQYSADPFASVFVLRKSRSATSGGQTILQAGDALFNFTGQASDGTKFVDAARIRMEVDGTPGVNDMPGRMTFWTTPDGALSTVERMRIDSVGNVGIGTTSPQERLHVNGNIRASGSITAFASPDVEIPDYVFEPGYKPMSLDEVGKFVELERHLPDIPPAAEIRDKGLSLADFQLKLLQKIEELTLYALEQAKTIKGQKERLTALEQALEQLVKQQKR